MSPSSLQDRDTSGAITVDINMDLSPQTNYHKARYKALDTPNLASV